MNTLALAPVCCLVALAACDVLGPQASDETLDAAVVPPIDAATHLLPPGAAVPALADDAALASQVRTSDGLGALADGIVHRVNGKAAGAAVRYWSFGAAPMATPTFPVVGRLDILADPDGAGGFVARADHPWLVAVLPGDPLYSPIVRVFYVPVTATYAGERITSAAALTEAIERGLVGEPVSAGTWLNLPVVRPGTRLEVAADTTVPAREIYVRGYRAEAFALGYPQPLRNGVVPVGQGGRLLSGVPAADGSLTVVPDAAPVFQFGVPAAPPTTAFNYTPLTTAVDVRLAAGVAPADVADDAALFRRSATGAITAFFPQRVASFTITTTVNNFQLQFAEGAP